METEKLLVCNNFEITRINGRKEKKVVSGFSAKLFPGTLTALCGKNGSGKTSLIKALGGINLSELKIKNDGYFYGDKNLNLLPARDYSKTFSTLFQNEENAWNFSVYDYILTGRFPHTNFSGFYSQKDKALTEQIISELKLSDLANEKIFNISGGEFQKARIARALVQEPKILLLDEPDGNLDINVQFEFFKLLLKTIKEKQICCLASIHDLNQAALFSHRIILISKIDSKESQMFFSGTPEEVINKQNVDLVYGTDCEIFIHPIHHKPQVSLK